MKYRVIKGELVIHGKSPDGDTIGFRLDEEHRSSWVWSGKKDGSFPRFNKGYVTNIRFEAIDALELHYSVPDVWPSVHSHQDLGQAKAARDEMLRLCGFDLEPLVEDERHRISDPSGQSISAVIAYREIDSYGRLIAFVFPAGALTELSSEKTPEIYLAPESFLHSVNAELLTRGMVFPTYYGTLDHEVRDLLSEKVEIARMDRLGVWSDYRATVRLPRKPTIPQIESMMLMPKVYRRLVSHIARNGAMSNFRSTLREDTVVDTKDACLADLGVFLRSSKAEDCAHQGPPEDAPYDLRMTRHPEELVFKP